MLSVLECNIIIQNFEVRGRFVGQPTMNCTVSKHSPCKAYCNGQNLDISKVFNYP